MFQKKVRATLKYGLHLDAVTPKEGPTTVGGALDVTKNNCELLKYELH